MQYLNNPYNIIRNGHFVLVFAHKTVVRAPTTITLQIPKQWTKANLIVQILFQSGVFRFSSEKPIIRPSHANHRMHNFETPHGFIK